MRTPTLLMLTTGLSAWLAPALGTQAACDPQVVSSPTHFPIRSQVRGQQGAVLLEVTVEPSGRVSATQLLRSSGSTWLDRAAMASVRNHWQFDVTSCRRMDLPATDLIAIEYRYETATK